MQNIQYSRCKIKHPRQAWSICIWHFKAALIRVCCLNKGGGQCYWNEWCGPYYKVQFIQIFALGIQLNNLNFQDRFIYLRVVDERLKIIWLPNASKNLCYLLLNRGECIENRNESWWHYRILYNDFYLYMCRRTIYLLFLRFCGKSKLWRVI